jgi:glyoxylase-like metal-dependent hydrolase (beta-lactamase superfamily II)
MCEHACRSVTELGAASDVRSRSVAKVHELAEGIVRLPTRRNDPNSAFLLDSDDEINLGDIGRASTPDIALGAPSALWRATSDIRRRIVTRSHPDHVRGLAQIRRQCKAHVLIHCADATWLHVGRVPGGGRHSRPGTVPDGMPVMHWETLDPDRTLEHEGTINGLRVIHPPSHAPGQVALLHEPIKPLLTGDAVQHRGPEPTQGPQRFLKRPFAARISLARLPPDMKACGSLTDDGAVAALPSLAQREHTQALSRTPD